MYNYPNEFIKIHSYDLSYISYFLKNVPKNAITEIFSLNKRNNHCSNIILTLTVANFTSVKDNGKMKGGSIIWNKKKKKEKKKCRSFQVNRERASSLVFLATLLIWALTFSFCYISHGESKERPPDSNYVIQHGTMIFQSIIKSIDRFPL